MLWIIVSIFVVLLICAIALSVCFRLMCQMSLWHLWPLFFLSEKLLKSQHYKLTIIKLFCHGCHGEPVLCLSISTFNWHVYVAYTQNMKCLNNFPKIYKGFHCRAVWKACHLQLPFVCSSYFVYCNVYCLLFTSGCLCFNVTNSVDGMWYYVRYF